MADNAHNTKPPTDPERLADWVRGAIRLRQELKNDGELVEDL